jgi:hypothetical protein
VAHCVF